VLQEQDSPPSSLFSFSVDEFITREEVDSDRVTSQLPDEVKTKHREALKYLDQDITALVQDAMPIRPILSDVKDQLTVELQSALPTAAYV